MKIRVAIVEDDKHYSQALKSIIDFQEDMECAAQFFNGKSALQKLEDLEPDVVLMDIQLQDASGIDIVSKLTEAMPGTSFIMCTSFENDEKIFSALRAGASGYLVKGDPLDKIIQAILEAHKGGAPMSFTIAKRVLQHFQESKVQVQSLALLTVTEKEVLELLAQGLLYKEIADKKNVTIDTIKKHIGNIYRKLQVSNKIEAINKFNTKN
ncbi:response regulator transcription factor [Flavobacterium johnsoniae]|jgi:DNA-binding NarL/FixJ family response regulator|uniref:Two component transcriptional regulator, LuxR family n=1 Tax=Flavobacterium johnsoniae (strain ATCC 17061 / DSM 2064 / JCM 8514 / BCRC 14874 / CCUG 350202 / NBRC 14942 / NCIMB 11054 / UW101) TaxID=376686 RepID=A5FAM9_FLAJ1|nr:response regulator transcription factor [Flavobacterium johnsoniae]ABQ07734.1 two component transcriptional regulator, LuxR family [Flavobacterium johnsoniae UW101]OXG01818.1 DNA-binding response regulator [Flavobacterium johnsoniae UW101]WQG80426.1 response regulator transcription factor [Flavobacterium johnsoniae UW101]SHL03772.1 two component transcriptional regulator, LuxR family [Flavobacterium johnsoniae]